MADEIIMLEERSEKIRVAWKFAISGGIKVTATPPNQGTTPVPVAAPPPPYPADDQGNPTGWALLLTAEERALVDSGDLWVETRTFGRGTLSGAAMLAQVQTQYAARQTELATEYATRFDGLAQWGARFDAS